MLPRMRSVGVSGDVYGRWCRRAVWQAVTAPGGCDSRELAASIHAHLQRTADEAASTTRFELREASEGFHVSGRDATGTGVDVIVRHSGELTVTPHEEGRPLAVLEEDFRRDETRDGLEYRAAPWRRHGDWLRFEAQIALRPDLA